MTSRKLMQICTIITLFMIQVWIVVLTYKIFNLEVL